MKPKYDPEYAAQVSRFLDEEIGPPLFTAPFILDSDTNTNTFTSN